MNEYNVTIEGIESSVGENVIEGMVEGEWPSASNIEVEDAAPATNRVSRGSISFDSTCPDAFEQLIIDTLEQSDFIETQKIRPTGEVIIYEIAGPDDDWEPTEAA